MLTFPNICTHTHTHMLGWALPNSQPWGGTVLLMCWFFWPDLKLISYFALYTHLNRGTCFKEEVAIFKHTQSKKNKPSKLVD